MGRGLVSTKAKHSVTCMCMGVTATVRVWGWRKGSGKLQECGCPAIASCYHVVHPSQPAPHVHIACSAAGNLCGGSGGTSSTCCAVQCSSSLHTLGAEHCQQQCFPCDLPAHTTYVHIPPVCGCGRAEGSQRQNKQVRHNNSRRSSSRRTHGYGCRQPSPAVPAVLWRCAAPPGPVTCQYLLAWLGKTEGPR